MRNSSTLFYTEHIITLESLRKLSNSNAMHKKQTETELSRWITQVEHGGTYSEIGMDLNGDLLRWHDPKRILDSLLRLHSQCRNPKTSESSNVFPEKV